ncbi:MAG: hypothetical protein K2M61_00720 [Muribaculaceae bacterium]|nr:hypothetical protein [Muribaculaceae bacterium]
MNKTLKILISSLFIFSLLSCHKHDEPKPASEADFAVLVYMVASNDLGSAQYDRADSIEMTLAAADIPANTRWLVYHAPYTAAQPALRELHRDGSWSTIKTYTPRESATTDRLRQVIADFRAETSPKADGIVFWSHASGWLEDGISQTPDGMQKSFGSDFGKKMNVSDMAVALADAPFRYIYFDACYMGSVEVAYELQDCADYLVGSPSELPAAGMPYDRNLSLLLTGTKEALIQAAKNTFGYYNSQVDPEMRTCTMTVVDTDGMQRLAAATAAIYKDTPLDHPLLLVTNYRGTARAGYSLDFGEYVAALCNTHNLDPVLLAEFESALSSAVIYSDATEMLWNSWPMLNPTGLSTYIFNDPAKFTTQGYDRLRWANDVVKPRLQ